MKMPKTYVSGKIATIIMLQAVFLVGILAFSGGIILHKDAAGPLTDTMLKPGLGGAEVDTDPAAYQRLQGKEQLLAGMLADLKAGRVPEGVTEAGTTKDGQTLYSTTVAGVTLLLLPTGKIAELAEVAPAMQGQVGIIKASSAGQDIGTLSEEAVGELNQMPGFNEEVGNLVGPIQVQSLGEVNRILAERAQGFRYIQPSVVKAGGTPVHQLHMCCL
jgi:hypothetical protein